MEPTGDKGNKDEDEDNEDSEDSDEDEEEGNARATTRSTRARNDGDHDAARRGRRPRRRQRANEQANRCVIFEIFHLITNHHHGRSMQCNIIYSSPTSRWFSLRLLASPDNDLADQTQRWAAEGRLTTRDEPMTDG